MCTEQRTHKSLPLHDNLMVEVESGADLTAGQNGLRRQVAAVVLWQRESAQGQFEPSSQVNASHFTKPSALEEMGVSYRQEITLM